MLAEYTPALVTSESDVEQKLIVPLLTLPHPLGLGYELSDFRTKPSLRALVIGKGSSKKSYIPDYAIVLSGLPVAIIEAKRPGEDLPEALREARLYATELNAMYPAGNNPCERVVATDGLQIVAQRWDGGDVITVTAQNLAAVDPAFAALLQFVGKSSTAAAVEKYLTQTRKKAEFVTPVQLMGGSAVAEQTVGENSFGANVTVEYRYLFDPRDADDRAKLVKNAYVTSRQRKSHVSPIDRIIRAAIPAHVQNARGIVDTAHPTALVKELTLQRAGELCLLIGSAGSGKSTFTDFVRVKGISKELASRTDWIHVDLNPAPLTRERIYDWLITQIDQQLRVAHPKHDFDTLDFKRKIYATELSRAEKGRAELFPPGSPQHTQIISDELARLEANRQETLRSTVNHLYRLPGRLLVVVLDNCDKRTLADQLLMFDVARWLKENVYCVVFLPLRDTTYDNYRNQPPLDTVVKDLVFRIDPPTLDKVIQARLDYAMREMRSQQSPFYFTMNNGYRIACSRDDVGHYLSALVSSVFQNRRLKSMISGLAGRNIRKGIEILLDICKSGHIPEEEILKARSVKGHGFPSHLVMQILMKGKRKYYADESAHIKNVFHSNAKDALPDPFVRLATLRWLYGKRNELGPNRTKGFHKLGALLTDLNSHGFAERNILDAVHDLIEGGCISSESSSANPDREDLVSLASGGDIHLSLMEDAQYFATIAEAVLFRENQVANSIKELMLGNGQFRAGSRECNLEISESLIEYLSRYYSAFHVHPAHVLDDSQRDDYIRMEAMRKTIAQQIDNSRPLAAMRRLRGKYPKDSEVDAVVGALVANGAIVTFGDGEGFLRAGPLNRSASTLQVGAVVRVRIGEWSTQHSRFEVKAC